MKKTLSAVALAGAFVLAGAGAANAITDPLQYPGAPAQGTVDTGITAPGEPVTLGGSGFVPGEVVAISAVCIPERNAAAGGQLMISDTVTADSQGNYTYSAVFQQEGSCTISALGSASGLSTVVQVIVDAPTVAAPRTDELASTGMEAGVFVWGAAGIAALGLGAASVATARRRTTVQP